MSTKKYMCIESFRRFRNVTMVLLGNLGTIICLPSLMNGFALDFGLWGIPRILVKFLVGELIILQVSGHFVLCSFREVSSSALFLHSLTH